MTDDSQNDDATLSLAAPAPLWSARLFQQIMEAQATFLQAAWD